eukprot:TRINITY_DN50533_c0_g1_i1.p1 TRINITY_DN50533_c0_g1~~TRINITY_DN50533_c0_g1_i1.p1  ORF type:complete len:161 (+),score=26.16 TRINITY_DN50533_c0_g1_i1:234-716(+)
MRANRSAKTPPSPRATTPNANANPSPHPRTMTSPTGTRRTRSPTSSPRRTNLDLAPLGSGPPVLTLPAALTQLRSGPRGAELLAGWLEAVQEYKKTAPKVPGFWQLLGTVKELPAVESRIKQCNARVLLLKHAHPAIENRLSGMGTRWTGVITLKIRDEY